MAKETTDDFSKDNFGSKVGEAKARFKRIIEQRRNKEAEKTGEATYCRTFGGKQGDKAAP